MISVRIFVSSRRNMSAKKIIFITGTDTGVGKTLLAALLLHHLRETSVRALAMKPFCSGGLGDVRLLQSLQPGELSAAEMNPFYFAQPIAPLVAAAKNRKKIRLSDVLERITQVKRKCDRLIIEGSGGLLVPLGDEYTVADLITRLDCQVVVVARNRLGTINHTLLTISALQAIGLKPGDLAVVLMSGPKPDLSSQTNPKVIAKLLPKISVFNLPFLSSKASSPKAIKANYPKVKRILTKLVSQMQ
jgi:dethiobiotin synthetase